MLATGCRIGEALALRHGSNSEGRPLLDLAAKTWEVNATVVRVPKTGLIVQPRPKTEAGWRVVAVPDFAVEMVRSRSAQIGGVVFGSPLVGTLRDPSNASGDLRQLLDSFDCEACSSTGFWLEPDGSYKTGPRGQRVRCDQGPWSWVTSHVFRKTVATRLDEAGFTPRQVADQLGHANPSMTLDVYFGRHVVSAAAAKVLDR
jgi:integrase